MIRRRFCCFIGLSVVAFASVGSLGACSEANTGAAPVTPAPDGASGDPRPDESARVDSGNGGDAAAGTTSIVIAIDGAERTLDRAQFGDNEDDAGAQRFHVEAHFGGDPACPEETSPSPERTLIVSNLPRGEAGATFTKADGVTAAYLDFKGDHIDASKPVTSASAVTVKILAVGSGATPADLAFEVDATFREGTAKGTIFATFCPSMAE